MLAVIFEITPTPQGRQDYFDIASDLKASLIKIDGFISVERFQSLTSPGTFLSLSFWRDEEAVSHWRNLAEHRAAQQQGLDTLFEHYRIRVAQVCRDYNHQQREQAPDDSQ
ncbi:antibiotic biosynthesis monooxygenase family protein [Neptunicella sp. SCSIO 80796]|uniref:antibiotic biosynthesis monooxygenase family protein n=1 Tax=Neptunicella plasticusilytica TaxID=3117012 RepID=UPI003A4D2578